MTNKSSVEKKGKKVKMIFHFVGEVVRTFESLDTHTIKDGQMFKIEHEDGRMLIINRKNLLMTEVFPE